MKVYILYKIRTIETIAEEEETVKEVYAIYRDEVSALTHFEQVHNQPVELEEYDVLEYLP